MNFRKDDFKHECEPARSISIANAIPASDLFA